VDPRALEWAVFVLAVAFVAEAVRCLTGLVFAVLSAGP